MQLFLTLTLVVVSTYANQGPGPAQRPGVEPPGFNPLRVNARENCLIELNGVEVTKELTDAPWDDVSSNGWPVKCKCVPFNYGLFSVGPTLNENPKKWCDLMGCQYNGKFIAPMETAHNCECIPGTDTDVQDSSFKYHCKKDDE